MQKTLLNAADAAGVGMVYRVGPTLDTTDAVSWFFGYHLKSYYLTRYNVLQHVPTTVTQSQCTEDLDFAKAVKQDVDQVR